MLFKRYAACRNTNQLKADKLLAALFLLRRASGQTNLYFSQVWMRQASELRFTFILAARCFKAFCRAVFVVAKRITAFRRALPSSETHKSSVSCSFK